MSGRCCLTVYAIQKRIFVQFHFCCVGADFGRRFCSSVSLGFGRAEPPRATKSRRRILLKPQSLVAPVPASGRHQGPDRSCLFVLSDRNLSPPLPPEISVRTIRQLRFDALLRLRSSSASGSVFAGLPTAEEDFRSPLRTGLWPIAVLAQAPFGSIASKSDGCPQEPCRLRSALRARNVEREQAGFARICHAGRH